MQTIKYLLPLLLVSCGRDTGKLIAPKQTNADFRYTREQILEPWFKSFEQTYGIGTRSIATQFIKIEDAVGQCHIWSDGSKRIDIDPDYWNSIPDLAKENLIFHELGHCALDLAHNENKIELEDDSIPESIMYPYVFGMNWNYKAFRNYYLKELKYEARR